MQKVEQSLLADAVVPARVVPNGVDLSVFRPAEQLSIRMELGLPHDACVLLFVADKPKTNRRKDLQTVRRAAQLASEIVQARPVYVRDARRDSVSRTGHR
jgi:hypothetical protein